MRRWLVGLVALVVLAVTDTGRAGIILPDLPVGSQYQLIFVTQGEIEGTSPYPSVYNNFANSEAALNPELPDTTWHAVVSTPYADAKDNAPSLGFPVYNTQGLLVAHPEEGLYGGSNGCILSPIRYDQFGVATARRYVWSGTRQMGGVGDVGARLGETADFPPYDLVYPRLGDPDSTSGWLQNGATTPQSPQQLFALSDPVTVVPERLKMVDEQFQRVFEYIDRRSQEIMRHFDVVAEQIRHDAMGANRDEIATVKDRVTRLERHTGMLAA